MVSAGQTLHTTVQQEVRPWWMICLIIELFPNITRSPS